MRLISIFFYFFTLTFFFVSFPVSSQNETSEKTAIDYRLETFGSVASQSTTPFWIHNNTQGIVPLEANHAALLGNVSGFYNLNQKIRFEAGMEIVGVTTGIAESIGKSRAGVFLQQLYASVTYRSLKLTIGMKPVYHSILDRSLSSGDFSFSQNARPIPEIHLEMPDYVIVPYTKNYLRFKFDFAFGKFMDDAYIRAVKAPNASYAQNIQLHHKSVFFSIPKLSEKVPLQVIVGVEDCAQWGGWNSNIGNLPQSFSDFFRILYGGGGGQNSPSSDQINRLGNHLGTYSVRFAYAFAPVEVALYKQHYYEDNSGMEYANWSDGIWGAECRFLKQPFLKKIVFEYIQTTNQSGPFHFPFHKEFPQGMKPRIGGGDNYYNHGEYTNGWSYFGRALGNPLLTSPEYNQGGALGFQNNRIKALHLGAQGNILPNLSYRILETGVYGYGTHVQPFLKRECALSSLFECNYILPKGNGWEVGIQFATDRGSLYGNNAGALLRIAKTGVIFK